MPPAKYTIRKAVRDDMNDVIDMIQELAEFEKMPNEPKLTVEDLIRDGGYDSDTLNPLFFCFMAEEEIEATETTPVQRKSIGYVMCFTGYSTWHGKSLVMKDLYVREQYRSFGIGKLLFKAMGQFAKDEHFNRIDFHVLNWNPATNFYKKMGAHDLTETEDWALYRIPL